MKTYDLEERLIQFSANVIIGVTTLKKSFASEHLTKQLIRSATSSALNYGEAQAAESKRDFVHKNENLFERVKRISNKFKNIRASELNHRWWKNETNNSGM